MSIVNAEMESFFCKFSLLANYGVNANLTFDVSDGKVIVNLKADLGFLIAPEESKHHASSNSRVTKPSRVRRRHRRAAERAAKLEPNNNDFNDVTTTPPGTQLCLILPQLLTFRVIDQNKSCKCILG